MADLMASGRVGHASTMACRRASDFPVFASTAPACAPMESDTACFPHVSWQSASDSKSGAGLPVAGSTPVPSAWPAAKESKRRRRERKTWRADGIRVRRRHFRCSAPRLTGRCQWPRCLAAGGKATATRLYIIAQGWPTAGGLTWESHIASPAVELSSLHRAAVCRDRNQPVLRSAHPVQLKYTA